MQIVGVGPDGPKKKMTGKQKKRCRAYSNRSAECVEFPRIRRVFSVDRAKFAAQV